VFVTVSGLAIGLALQVPSTNPFTFLFLFFTYKAMDSMLLPLLMSRTSQDPNELQTKRVGIDAVGNIRMAQQMVKDKEREDEYY